MVETHTMPKKAGDDSEVARALLTNREREIVSGDADVSDNYRYQTISRVRRRFQRLQGDMRALDAHGDLGEEVRDVVCGGEDE